MIQKKNYLIPDINDTGIDAGCQEKYGTEKNMQMKQGAKRHGKVKVVDEWS